MQDQSSKTTHRQIFIVTIIFVVFGGIKVFDQKHLPCHIVTPAPLFISYEMENGGGALCDGHHHPFLTFSRLKIGEGVSNETIIHREVY